MPGKWIRFSLRLTVIVLLLSSVGRAADVSWIKGSVRPANWSIQPAKPSEADVVRFSGPTGLYLNRWLAEREFGGRPAIRFDTADRRIELFFQPPAREAEQKFWDPVCGLQGTFGPLEPGAWQFFCDHDGASFSLPFEVAATAPAQTVLYVDASAAGAETGLTWDDAFVDLQAAIAVATEGTEIRVARGMYVPHDMGEFGEGAITEDADPGAAFELKTGVILKGGYAGSSGLHPNERDLVAYESVLSGDLYGDDRPFAHLSQIIDRDDRSENTYHVIVAIGADSTAVLDGFTITGGYAFAADLGDSFAGGAGIYIERASPTIRNCLITGNAAALYGAGVYALGRCTPIFVDCVIADNWSDWWGGGLLSAGSDIRMERCLISGNWARYRGGGIYNSGNASTTLANCILSGNVAVEPDWGRGGALYNSVGELRLRHCTLVGNRASNGPSVALDSHGRKESDVRVHNSILWDGADAIRNHDGSPLVVEYSNVRGGWQGRGNIDADPCVVDAGYWDLTGTLEDLRDDRWFEGDYRLRWDSPCLDAGDPDLNTESGARDFFGRARLSGSAVDVGACELTNEPPVADAGPNVAGFSLDGISGLVTLDAGRSFDPEGQPLTSRWYRDGELLSEQAQCTVDLPLGDHVLTLIVDDGVNVSEPDEIVASVMNVTEVPVMIAPKQIKREESDGFVVVMALAPQGRPTSDLDSTEPMLLFPGGIEAVTQAATMSLTRRTLILAKFPVAGLLAAEPIDGVVELRIVGRFKDGRFFSGTGDARIVASEDDR